MKFMKGGITHSEVWSLPVALRRFYLEMVVNDIEKQNQAVENQNSKMPKIPRVSNTSNTPNMPNLSRFKTK
tara:strand:- start:20396 stop:20608 length:213 start_codon:yes stop_codon:yes gene_type:complete